MRRSLRWTRPLVFCHAVVPFPFQFQVRHQAQESPFEFLPAEPGIQQSASWRSHPLQVPDLRPVTVPRRLEDPAPQPPYVVLVQPPVNGVPLQGHVLGSVHHHGRLTCPSVPAYPALRLSKAHPPHVSLLSQPGTRPGIRPVIRRASGWRTGTALPLSRCLSAAGIGFLGVLFPPGDWAPLTVGLPAAPRR